MFNLNFEKIFQDIFNALSEKVDDIGSIAASVIGIGALFYFASKTWSALAKNEPIDIYPLLKPLVIVLLCLNFNSLVIAPMHYILAPFRTYTLKLLVDTKNDTQAYIDDVVDKAKEERKKKRDAETRWWMKFMAFVEDGATDLSANIGAYILKFILEVFSCAKYAIYIIMNFLRVFFLVILGMIGPIAFALSLFPSFENSLSNWFAKYVSIYLWAPICNVISLILDQAEFVLTSTLLTGTAGGFVFMAVMLLVFYIIGFYSYLSIPTIATWAVQGGVTSMELASTLKGTRKAALVAGGAAAASSGRMAGNLNSALINNGGISGILKNAASRFKK
ncbi:MAG: hypothetical protein LBR10_16015 [Prevotellaceae bacterium]|jgi:conjugative transposon TraJ protein|nr:hypothetical protein [Prevotellaceae bacterium]